MEPLRRGASCKVIGSFRVLLSEGMTVVSSPSFLASHIYFHHKAIHHDCTQPKEPTSEAKLMGSG